jgi:hypothetical protein
VSKQPKPPLTKKEAIARAIAACRDANGNITPAAVVAAARNKNNILHGEFEWDDEILIQQALERRAADLIRQCRSIILVCERTVAHPKYVSDPRVDGRSYVETTLVAKSKDLSLDVLDDEVKRIRAMVHRAMTLAVVFGMQDEFETLLQQVVDIERKIAEEYRQ